MVDFSSEYCPYVDGKCPYFIEVCFGCFWCEEDCPYFSGY